MKKTAWFTGLAVLAFLLFAIVWSTTPQPAISAQEKDLVMEKPTWKSGDLWEYSVMAKEQSKINKFTQVRRYVKQEDGMHLLTNNRSDIFYYDSDLNFKFQKDGDGKIVVSYSPAQPTFNWPLKIKKKWHGRFSWSPKATDDPEYLDVSVKVDKIETIAVMGREVAAFKMIEYRYNPRGALVAEMTKWVAPEYKNIIRWMDKRELARRYYEGELITFKGGE